MQTFTWDELDITDNEMVYRKSGDFLIDNPEYKTLDDSLTDEQCRQVLQAAESDHDAEIGINWDVLQFHIDELDN